MKINTALCSLSRSSLEHLNQHQYHQSEFINFTLQILTAMLLPSSLLSCTLIFFASLSRGFPQQPSPSATPRPAPHVATPQGTYVGDANVPGVDQFLSIPYAEPPLGQLRFADPMPYHSGAVGREVNVSSYGPGCLQDPTLASDNGLSEDCLTLNVIRPASNGSEPEVLLPVMVFIFGGANFLGEFLHLFCSALSHHSILLFPT